jgi:hypothetical protein
MAYSRKSVSAGNRFLGDKMPVLLAGNNRQVIRSPLVPINSVVSTNGRQTASCPQPGFGEINGDVLEDDFWPAQALVLGLSEDLRQGSSHVECLRSARS